MAGIFRRTWYPSYRTAPQAALLGALTAESGGVHALTATGITTTPTVGTPALGQGHVLVAAGITASPTVGGPALGQVHALAATGVTTTPTVGAPAIGQVHALTATGITTTPVVGTPVLAEEGQLVAVGITTTPTVGSPALGQVHALVATGIATGAPTVGAPGLDLPVYIPPVLSTQPVASGGWVGGGERGTTAIYGPSRSQKKKLKRLVEEAREEDVSARLIREAQAATSRSEMAAAIVSIENELRRIAEDEEDDDDLLMMAA